MTPHGARPGPGARRAPGLVPALVPALAAALLAAGLALGAGSADARPVGPVPPPVVPPTTAPTTTPTTAPTPPTATTVPPTPTAPPSTAPAAEAVARYVALGDSWAAGTAAGDVDPASGTCRRSRGAYPVLVARAANEPRWLSRACASREAGSGNTQFTSLSPDVRAVTATVGADAVGLGDLLRACSRAATARDCDAAAARSDTALAALPRNLDVALGELRRSAPRAAVTFVGYPLPAEGSSCPAGPADTDRAARADAVVTRLDAVLLERTQAAQVRFVDVRQAFAGHAVCAARPWLTSWTGSEARLAGAPNGAGHAAGYRPAVSDTVVGALAVPAGALAVLPTTDPPSTADAQRAERRSAPGTPLFPG